MYQAQYHAVVANKANLKPETTVTIAEDIVNQAIS